jgi:hypothetical protein
MTAGMPRRKRLHRLGVLYVRSPIYFVTTCTVSRKNILANDSVHRAFVAFGRQGEAVGAHVGR